MATNLPTTVIDIHNTMVDKLSQNTTPEDLQRLKDLYNNIPLTRVDMITINTVPVLITRLMDEKIISYGDYKILVPKLESVKPILCDIVNQCTEDIRRILKSEPETEKTAAEDPVIMMYEPKYHTRVGSTAFLDCTVHPVPERILWKRNKSPPPTGKLFADNRKYHYRTTSPTLMIRNPNKIYDEAHYQCTAEANGNRVYGDIVELKVSDDEPRESSTTELHPQQRGERAMKMKTVYTVALVLVISGIQRVLFDYDHGSSLSYLTSNGWTLIVSTVAALFSDWLWCRFKDICSPNQGCLMLFKARNANIDMERQESKKDIESTFAKRTHQEERVKNVQLKTGSVQVCIYITGARSPSEPSSVHLAEEFKHYLLDGGTIQLTDESQTVLDIDNDSFQIIPHKAREDDLPYVNISHGEFTVPVGKTAIIQSYVIASPKVTSIQWFKIEGDEDIPLEIDNKRYFGSCDTTPTLIIRKTNIDDQGQYRCTATNCNGTGWSDVSVLSIQSGNDDVISIEKDDGAVGTDNDAIRTDDGAVSGDDGAIRTDDDVVSGDDGAVRTDDGAVRTDDGAVRTDDGAVRTDDGAVRTDDDAVRTGDDDAIRTDDDAIRTDDDAVSGDDDAIRTDDGAVSGDADAVRTDDGAVRTDDGAVSGDGDAIRTDDGAVSGDGDAVRTDDDAIRGGDPTATEQYQFKDKGPPAAKRPRTERVLNGR
ncbi:uncharacterized protein LOC117332846 [Pecten maximus]|uniref:uncharacterized protein LOC117332846 n=1 Tax=Pecten maximus TaxID=6579 RepID=UPI001458D9EA|nr:uncharacterized protein LOC117332846 [Pecten maximus]